MNRSRPSLPLPLRELLEEPPLADARAALEGVRAQGRRKRRRVRAVRAGLGLAAALLLIAFLPRAPGVRLLLESREPAPLRLATKAVLPANLRAGDTHRAIALSDGSWLTLGAHAELEVLESSSRVFRLALRKGRVRFDVRPHGPRTWIVECATVTVEVVGTGFVVDRGTDAVRVQVARGAVLVRGSGVPDGVQRLVAGQALEIALPGVARVPVRPTPVPVATPAPAAVPPQSEAVQPSPAWRGPARRGEWSRAWQALHGQGFEATVKASRGIEDLLLLADIARLSGHASAAVAPLERVAQLHANDSRASLAVFTLATLRLDVLGDPARAARDVTRALALGLPRPLQQDAQARLVEAYARAGDRVRAQAAAADYRARFPNGSRRAQVDTWSTP